MKKRLEKITANKVIVFLFVLCIGFTCVMSLKGLMDYYVYDENPSSEWTPQVGDKMEADYSSVFWGKMEYVNLNGLCRKILNQHEMNGITKLNNGWLASIDTNSDTDIVIQNAQKVGMLNQCLSEHNVELLYVVVPDTVSKYDMQLPKGVYDYSNKKLDVFIEQLEKENVKYLDIRECMYEEGINQYDYFYKTDHHWNVRGGMYAATQIIERAENLFAVDVDDSILDVHNYITESYPKWHLGSRGQRVGRYFAGIDDFEIIYPDFETSIERKSDGKRGSFKDIFICYDALYNKKYTSRYTYDKTYNSIEDGYINMNAPLNKRMLILSDSMGRVVVPYLSLAFTDVDSIVYETITERLIEEERPDIMVILLHPMSVFQEDFFNFEL